MAKQTDIMLRTWTFYQVFPRQHSKTHDLKGVINDLDRIKDLGVDVIYVLPLHPIGKKARKGSQGSPYSIVNYREIHSDLGTMEDFDLLVKEAHGRGLKVMMDIVFNHTSKDAVYVESHPEWYIRNQQGELANRVGDWSDIADLDFKQTSLWDELIDVLCFWAKKVDGFRCDVAPLIPLDFWLKAREKVSIINPDMIWLSESVHPGFIKYLRHLGFDCHSDAEMYQAFDILYDYDIFDDMNHYLQDPQALKDWMISVDKQDVIYPANYIKLRSFENHDQPRLRSKVRDEHHFKNMVALSFFMKGTAFIYAGMEHQVTHQPSLFEYDVIPWNQTTSLEPFFKRLAQFKKQPIFAYGHTLIHEHDGVVVMSHQYQNHAVVGVFNLEGKTEVKVPLIDGTYTNFIDEKEIIVTKGILPVYDEPIIIDTLKEHII
jgi:glycosidase